MTTMTIGLRGLVCAIAATAIIISVRLAETSGLRGLMWLGGLLAIGIGLLPALGRLITIPLGRASTSENFLLAQSKVNALTQSLTDMAAVHDGYREILRRWSLGSAEVFLSGGSFAARWPAEAFPELLLGRAAHEGAVTAEKLEAAGEQWLSEFHFMVRHQIGAVVCATTPAGERLVAAWSVRTQDGPFSQRELQEARDLLSSMLTGSHFVRMRQRLRGNDRLNFYARYAPQFAHELRNGLYLQTQLLRAIADGRGRDVRPSDAEAGLERTEHVDRLCDHFFNVGSLFNRPIERLNLRDELAGIVRRMRGQFDGGPELKLRLDLEPDHLAEIFGNGELLQMAVHNLVKNAVESSASSVEVLAARHLDKMHLLIRDNGPGLPDDRRIDPFSPGRSGKRDGMGLGLSIVRDCIEAMGGTVGVRFTGLEGTCFEVTLACAARLDGAAASCQFLTPIQ
jgi:signal transduction histidine kinase